MKTAEETYVQYLCRNCKNKHIDLCCIRRKIDNTLYCESYKKDKELEGYKKPLDKTAKFDKCVMPKLISNWNTI